jgi:hypothetical protein
LNEAYAWIHPYGHESSPVSLNLHLCPWKYATGYGTMLTGDGRVTP